MRSRGLGTVLREVHKLAAPDMDDGELLERFVATRDEVAFTVLVRRHGPRVLQVCRRVLRHADDAEDALQVTFLVLARSASSVRFRAALASWLYGVAHRSAMSMKRQSARRRRRERETEAVAPAADDLHLRELQAVLDEEVARLPEKYRAPFVLCCLDGKSREEAAAALGWKEGTVSGRLARAREALQARLARRGVMLTAALAAAALDPAAAGPFPHGLMIAASRLAGGTAPAALAALARQVLHSLLWARAGRTLIALAACLLATGVGAIVCGSLPARAAPQAQALVVQTEAPRQAAERPRRDLLGDPLPDGAVARIGTNRLRITGAINVAAFSDDGRRLAFGGERGAVQVCEAADGNLLLELHPNPALNSGITELAFSHDGRTVAAGGFWCKELWLIDLAAGRIVRALPNAAEGQEQWSRKHQGPGFAFTSDDRVLVVGGKDGALRLWDVATGAELATLAGPRTAVLSLTLSADGRTALTAHYEGEVHLWDVANRKHLRKLPMIALRPHFTALSPDGKTVAYATGDYGLDLCDLDGNRRRPLAATGALAGFGFTSDGASLRVAHVADGKGNVVSWDVESGKPQGASLTCPGIGSTWKLDDQMGPARIAWFRRDGQALAWTYGGVIRPWDLATGQEFPRQTLYRSGISWAGFSADGRLVRACGVRGEVAVWDAATGRLHGAPGAIDDSPSSPSEILAFASGAARGKVVAVLRGYFIGRRGPTQPGEGSLHVWDPGAGQQPTRIREQVAPIWYGAIAPGGRYLAATEAAGQIRVYDLAAGKPVRSFPGRDHEYHPTFSPDGKLLATGGDRQDIRLYEFATGRLLQTIQGPTPAKGLAFSPDGKILATSHSLDALAVLALREGAPVEDESIYLWDTVTGREIRRAAAGRPNSGPLAFSPDGTLLASGGSGRDGSVRLWEVATGKERRKYEGHKGPVYCVDFSPDGRRLISASYDGTGLIWQVPDDAAPARK